MRRVIAVVGFMLLTVGCGSRRPKGPEGVIVAVPLKDYSEHKDPSAVAIVPEGALLRFKVRAEPTAEQHRAGWLGPFEPAEDVSITLRAREKFYFHPDTITWSQDGQNWHRIHFGMFLSLFDLTVRVPAAEAPLMELSGQGTVSFWAHDPVEASDIIKERLR